MPLNKDTKVGPYILASWLGGGGNGEVWSAQGQNGEAAVKVLKTRRADSQPRFVREVTALERLQGIQGVLPILESGADPAVGQWFSMPVAVPIQEELGRDASFSAICIAMGAIADALSRVHAKGIAHRDIKPSNLFHWNGQWCLGDFGLADYEDAEALTHSNQKLGPAHYIAPEMLNHASSADGKRADIYSLGKTIWVMATGQTFPVPGQHDPSIPQLSVSVYVSDSRAAALDELLHRMTHLDPTRRPDAATVAKELADLAREREEVPPTDSKASLQKLRAALTSHFTREQEETRQMDMAEIAMGKLVRAIQAIVKQIEDETGLKHAEWVDTPEFWRFREHMGAPAVLWRGEGGFAFTAGNTEWKSRLGVGLCVQLLSDYQLWIHVGYNFDRLLYDRVTNSSSTAQAWSDGGSAMNGGPSCDALIDRLAGELNAKLPETLEQYTTLVQDPSQ